MVSLEEDIEEIEQLYEYKLLSLKLYRESLHAITCAPFRAGRIGWADPGDEIESALVLKAILKAKNGNPAFLGNMGKTNTETLIKHIDDIPLADFYNIKFSTVPVFTAARTMQALLLVPDAVFGRTTMRCYFRILREFHNTVPPKWITGGAAAGPGADQTAFVTSECIRALLTFSDILGRTADFFKELELSKKMRKMLSSSNEMPKQWLEKEKIRCSFSLYIKLKLLSTGILPNLHPLPREISEVDSFRSSLPINLLKQSKTVIKDLDEVIAEAKKFRESEKSKGERWIERTESSHLEAMRALFRAKAFTMKFKECLVGKKDWLDVDWAELEIVFREAEKTVRRVLVPAKNFMENIIDKELAEAQTSQEYKFDMAELAFAAASYGSIEKSWKDERLLKVAQHLMSKISVKGGVVRRKPIIDIGNGYLLFAHGYEVVRAIAHLLENVDLRFDPEVIGKFLRRIEREKVCSENSDSCPGWTHRDYEYRIPSVWWTTALVVHATHGLLHMIERKINTAIFKHFTVRMPSELKLEIDDLFIPDIGLLGMSGKHQRSISVLIQRMLCHILKTTSIHDEYGGACYSAILHGPPGTGKTTTLESLAKTANVPLIEITPSDIVVGGTEAVERKAKVVFDALSKLTNCVIIFDEFDPVLKKRSPSAQTPQNVFEFLTPGMLPKLRRLNEAAEKQSFVYALCTNLIGTLDDAIIREGRFDEKMGLYPPDLLSRAGRIISQLVKLRENDGRKFKANWQKRAARVVVKTRGGPMTTLGKPGWFSVKKAEFNADTVIEYIIEGKKPFRNWPESEQEIPKELNAEYNKYAKIEWNEWKWVDDLDKAAEGIATWGELLKILEKSLREKTFSSAKV